MALVFIGVLPGEEFYVYCGTALRMRIRNMTLPRQRRLLSAAKELLLTAMGLWPRGNRVMVAWGL
jgi:hypothetical protein